MADGHVVGPPADARSISVVVIGIVLLSCLGCGKSRAPAAQDASSLDAASTLPDVRPGRDAPSWQRPEAAGDKANGQACDGSAECMSGACTAGTCSEWSGTMQIRVDTTKSGANVAETVRDFPLLVRLNGDNFPFSEAQPDGRDIRFVDQDGATLPHEIERWEATLPAAEIWVLLSTVAANSSTNVLRVYWGNPTATATSSGPAVFRDYDGVFHMSPTDCANVVQADSTGNNRGTTQGLSSSSVCTEGPAGPAATFDGTSYVSTAYSNEAAHDHSVSAWLRTQSAETAGIAAFASSQAGHTGHFFRLLGTDSSGKLQYRVQYEAEEVTIGSAGRYDDGAWHHVVAQVSGTGQYLYVDGELIGDAVAPGTVKRDKGYWRFGDGSLSDGAFRGALDEVRVANKTWSAARIKLAFATQRPGTTSVIFQR